MRNLNKKPFFISMFLALVLLLTYALTGFAELPVADPNGPYSGSVGTPVAFDGTGSSDPDGGPLKYAWDFGDGNTGTGSTTTHAYDASGIYKVSLTVTVITGETQSAYTTATIMDAKEEKSEFCN